MGAGGGRRVGEAPAWTRWTEGRLGGQDRVTEAARAVSERREMLREKPGEKRIGEDLGMNSGV